MQERTGELQYPCNTMANLYCRLIVCFTDYRALKAFEGPMSLSSTDITAEESLFSTKSASAGGQGNNFKVVVRIRPPIKRERDGGLQADVLDEAGGCGDTSWFSENAVTCVSVVENETVRITSGVGESQFADVRSCVLLHVLSVCLSVCHIYFQTFIYHTKSARQ